MRVAEAIGQAVKLHREQAGLTQTELSDAVKELGVVMEPTTILRVEKGARQSVRVDELLAIAAVLGLPPSLLVAPIYGRTVEVGPHVLDAAQVLAWFAGDGQAAMRRPSPALADLSDTFRRREIAGDLADWLDLLDDALTRGVPQDIVITSNRIHHVLAVLVESCISDDDYRRITDRLGITEEKD
jgi:transcriptional regulator with XRE-family HTH domain